ncbi:MULTISPECIES: hypothetical protein [Gammaproteobacteria]|uniref:hypothetical protein n=1 Tax=Gammaproteobacteria TaxID=1236 RepID=UPI0011582084|nr:MULTISPECIES: hypothetical protein [Gammaproteobacteria]EGR4342694.1 hypothetical protein [Vibrio cholerae]EJL6618882.1 hypothetical protein [Vibrio cholerae]EJL6651569.1 hypothetical protein [Vibrio cholerae]EKF9280359.1 hypothetical protein [Vibrio cholerae]MBO2559376.1 hypothetical protein [Shewanella algae]
MKKAILAVATASMLSLAGCAANPDRVDGVMFTIEKASDGEPLCRFVYDPAKVTQANWEEVGQRLRSAYGSKLDQCTRFENVEAKE